MPSKTAVKITVAHSPDPDDAFMFYAIANKKIPTGEFEIDHVLADIETLNRLAFLGRHEITAVSLHAFAYLTHLYRLLPIGASIGKGYGPIAVAREPIPLSELPRKMIAVPGAHTTAHLTLGLAVGKFQFKIVPFDKIMEAVKNGEADAGLLIHEGQLTYGKNGLVKILDLGEWWEKKTKLPLPLGVDVIRKDLDLSTQKRLAEILSQGIRHAIEHEDDALAYAMRFGRGLDETLARKFVRMYVNERTLRYSDDDKKAVTLLLQEGYDRGLISVKPEFSFDLD